MEKTTLSWKYLWTPNPCSKQAPYQRQQVVPKSKNHTLLTASQVFVNKHKAGIAAEDAQLAEAQQNPLTYQRTSSYITIHLPAHLNITRHTVRNEI